MSSVARKGQVGIASVACLQAEKYRARVVFEFVGCCTGGLAAILRSCVGRLANTSGEFRVRQRCVMDLNHGGSVSGRECRRYVLARDSRLLFHSALASSNCR